MGATSSERERQAVLDEIGILDSQRESIFDDVAELAAMLIRVPIAMVNFIDRDRQWTKAAHGTEPLEIDRRESLCDLAVQAGAPVVVEDLTREIEFACRRFVAGPPHLRAYAGAPILVGGHALGALCVVDTVPRHFTPEQMTILSRLSDLIAKELAFRWDDASWRTRAPVETSSGAC